MYLEFLARWVTNGLRRSESRLPPKKVNAINSFARSIFGSNPLVTINLYDIYLWYYDPELSQSRSGFVFLTQNGIPTVFAQTGTHSRPHVSVLTPEVVSYATTISNGRLCNYQQEYQIIVNTQSLATWWQLLSYITLEPMQKGITFEVLHCKL